MIPPDTRETEPPNRETGTATMFLAMAAVMSLATASFVTSLVAIRNREPFVPAAECYTTLLGSTYLCKDTDREAELMIWFGVALSAGVTIWLVAKSVRLYFRNHRKTSS